VAHKQPYIRTPKRQIEKNKWGRRKIKVGNKIKVTRGKSKFTNNSPTRLKQLGLFLLDSSLIKYASFQASIIICKNSQFWQKSKLQFIVIKNALFLHLFPLVR
jgi:hypothetical protein